jgi:hypothetical protein
MKLADREPADQAAASTPPEATSASEQASPARWDGLLSMFARPLCRAGCGQRATGGDIFGERLCWWCHVWAMEILLRFCPVGNA